ncbi:hypothetical protein PUV47_18510 [Pseudovibrio exalbescens]|uniref:hypothetical protein n=1 Tax=Pseudovibrio exalbescens TaxID=197461 RepID=UPI00236730B5|nr:hypothetical protein [Pseudovibrio exalbescens]MDD7911930.1 hypothetical protein [Pseudovibrio exalbescens]
MADYYSVLKKTINGLQENTGSARRGVYQRARSAIVKQLQNYDPPLTPSQITEEQLKLEEAIRKVEAEAARASLGLGNAPAQPAKQPTAAPGGASGGAHAGVAGPATSQPAQRPPAPPQTAQAPVPPTQPQRPPASPSPYAAEHATQTTGAAGASGGAAEANNGPAEPDVFKQAVKAASDLGAAAHQASKKARDQLPGANDAKREPDLGDVPPAEVQPAVSSAYRPKPREEDVWVPGEARKQALAEEAKDDAEAPELAKRPRGKQRAAKASSALVGDAGLSEEGLRPSRMPQVIGIFIVLALLGAGGYALYSQKDDLMTLIEPTVTDGGSDTAQPAPAEEPEEPASNKNTDRLLNDDGSQVSPDARAVSTQRVTSVSRDVTNPGSGAEATPPPSLPVTPPDIPSPDEVDAVPVTTNSVRPAESLTAEAEQTAVAQQGILYEEAANPGESGTASRGNVMWSLDRGDSAGRIVKAVAVMPDRNVTITMSIKPNADNSLPASHLLELRFDLPRDFAGQGIAEVPGIIMKPTEQARGEPLAGAAVKVSDNFFWIALSDAEADRVTNMKRLEEREWIDIPLLYNNGKRAILTFEKGVSGNRVISQALESWN